MNSIMPLAAFFNPANIGPAQLIIILAIVLIIFGPKKLPGLGKAIGRSIREFRDGVKGLGSELDDEEETNEPARRSSEAPKPAEPAATVSRNSSSGEEPAKPQ